MDKYEFVPLPDFHEYPVAEMVERSRTFYVESRRRRSVRHFSDRPVPREIIENCLRTAGTAPSGAHRQPWRFVAVSDPAVKREIREGAEQEEREFYQRRATRDWLKALAPLGTDENKPFLEIAPYLIVVFAENFGLRDGKKIRNYYVQESVGIATGMLLSALHHAGLATLTHTPSPMRFLNGIVGRPSNERPYMIVVAGYPAEGALVPKIERRPLDEIATFR